VKTTEVEKKRDLGKCEKLALFESFDWRQKSKAGGEILTRQFKVEERMMGKRGEEGMRKLLLLSDENFLTITCVL